MSDSEARQLRLYAYLAAENGTDACTGAVVRGDGQRREFSISPAEAEAEADCAKKRLGRLNAAVSEGASFRDLASPSPSNCSFCPCLPFCGPFWTEAHAEWAADCGSHVEGKIAEIESRQIQGISLTTLVLSRRAGTVFAQHVSIEQIPSEWMRMDGLDLPHIGDAVRVVHGRQMETDGDEAVIRVDKALTAVWRLRQRQSWRRLEACFSGRTHSGQPYAGTTQLHDVPHPKQGHDAGTDDSQACTSARATVPHAQERTSRTA